MRCHAEQSLAFYHAFLSCDLDAEHVSSDNPLEQFHFDKLQNVLWREPESMLPAYTTGSVDSLLGTVQLTQTN